MFWRIAAGALRGSMNLLLSVFFAIKGALGLGMRPLKHPTAKPVSDYEPEFEEDVNANMDYSLPPGLVERHTQDSTDDR